MPGIFSDHACDTCGQVSCFRHGAPAVLLTVKPTTAFLLDAAWPEFKSYVTSNHSPQDILATPLDGKRWNRPAYDWPNQGFARHYTATLTTLLRAARSRRLAAQGAARQQALLRSAASLADELGKCLSPNVDEVCVSQSFLPFLWRSGSLGGRRFRVLMTQLPARTLQTQLDLAFKKHPESKTLRDFRAQPWYLEAEDEALHFAHELITPHALIAALMPVKTTLLEWALPKPSFGISARDHGNPLVILFPAATLARKGAYELREALNGLDVQLLLGGNILENESFWEDFNVMRVEQQPSQSWDLVVLPSIVESQPRSLLKALASGQTVITTVESGLHPNCGAVFVKALNVEDLRSAILKCLPTQQASDRRPNSPSETYRQ